MRGIPIGMALVLAGSVPGHAAEPSNVHVDNARMRQTLARAVEGAAERLRSSECATVLSDFQDGSGRSLRENLDELGVSAPDYLARYVQFYNGLQDGLCRKKRVLAVTEPGSRVVRVCWRFFREAGEDPSLDEALIIHETLHTLGLGENPPSSLEITARVQKRCH